MKQTLVSSHLSHYVGSKDPMYKTTSFSRMGFASQSPKDAETLGGWENGDHHPLKVAKVI